MSLIRPSSFGRQLNRMNQSRRNTWVAVGLVATVIVCCLIVFKTLAGSPGQEQANVAAIAKSIDHTKANTPSVSPEKLKMGFTGGKRPMAKD